MAYRIHGSEYMSGCLNVHCGCVRIVFAGYNIKVIMQLIYIYDRGWCGCKHMKSRLAYTSRGKSYFVPGNLSASKSRGEDFSLIIVPRDGGIKQLFHVSDIREVN